jgi:hypothetical protein
MIVIGTPFALLFMYLKNIWRKVIKRQFPVVYIGTLYANYFLCIFKKTDSKLTMLNGFEP